MRGGQGVWAQRRKDLEEANGNRATTNRGEEKLPHKRTAKQRLVANIKKNRAVAPKRFHSSPAPAVSEPAGASLGLSVHEMMDIAFSILKEVLIIFFTVLRRMKTIIAILLILSGPVLWFERKVSMLKRVLIPLCLLLSLFTDQGFCEDSSPGTSDVITGDGITNQVNYSTFFKAQTTMFDSLLEAAAGGSALSLEVKKAEIETNELVVKIQVSNLVGKEVLADALGAFAMDARSTSRSLQRFASKVNGAADSIMAVNKHAFQSILNARSQEHTLWSPHRLVPWKVHHDANSIITNAISEAVSILSTNIEHLIAEAEYSIANLVDLEDKLFQLHKITAIGDSSLSKDKMELSDQIWTRVGGNRDLLRSVNYQLAVIRALDDYRRQALAYVVLALESLHCVSDGMVDMKERLTGPAFAVSHLPAEVHLETIQIGIERLQEVLNRGKKLA